MRLTNLTLEKYGAIASRSVDIPQAAGLTIIYGANEAGKSTSLEAISDFLFGIPTRTARGNVFGYEAMRISAKLALADGHILSLTRAKRASKSLTDENGKQADAALATILGAMTRERYATLFGLNHESLRDGGERLLAADGEIGRLIVEAGGGLRHLVARLEDLEAKANDLYGARKSANRLFYQQLDIFNQADKDAKAASLSRDTYEQTRKAVEAAANSLAVHRKERAELAASAAKLQRISRVVPHLRAMDGYRAQLADSADLASYPADFAEKLRGALAAKADAVQRVQQAAQRAVQLNARLDGLKVNEALSAAQQQVQALDERATHVSKARGDRANRLKEIEDGEAKLAELRRLLGLSPDADLSRLTPDAAALKALRELAEDRMQRAPALAGGKARGEELADQLAVLDARLAAAKAAGHDKANEANAAQFGSLAAQKSALDVRTEALRAEQAGLAARLAELGFADVDALGRFVCPSADDMRAEQQQRQNLRARLEDENKAQRAAQRVIEEAERDIAALQISGDVASDASVADARARRAALWQGIKSAFVAGPLPDAVAQRLEAADQLDSALRTADELADRRASEAERAAHLAQAQRRVAEGRADSLSAEREMAALQQSLTAREGEWRASFAALADRFPELPAALHFVQQREAALDMADRLNRADQDLRVDAAQIAPLTEQMLRLEKQYDLDSSAIFSARVHVLQAYLAAHEKAYEAYARDAATRAEIAAQWQRHQGAQEKLQAAEDAALAAWPAATAALGLNAETGPQAAAAVLTEWVGARGVLDSIGITKKRLLRMAEDEESLAADVAALAKALSLDLGEDNVAAAKMLREHCAQNAQIKSQRDALTPDIEEAKLAHDQALAACEKSEGQLSELAALVQMVGADEDALRLCAARLVERAALMAKLKAEEQTASSAGDQQDIETLRAEWGGRDLDEVRAELTLHAEQAASFEREIESAILAEKEAKDQLASFASEGQVNHAVAAREAAAAQMHLALERYLEISMARDLVMQAMANLRAQQQDPLIAQAGDYFAAMTLGEFSGIEADVDDKGQPVVIGRRTNGERAFVHQMSDGTRDQLFLAFRLASIAQHASSVEPLPFIADDILVHFDDARSAATLNLLAEFGKGHQILLFTHHQSVRDLAGPLAEQGAAQILSLDRVQGAAA